MGVIISSKDKINIYLPLVVYIAGYGRSGSTVLDVLLGSHSQMLSTGELTFLFKDAACNDRSCSCGKTYIECTLWGDILRSTRISANEANNIIRLEESPKLLIRKYLLGKEKRNINKLTYKEINLNLFKKLGGFGFRYIVDSSKTASEASLRPFELSKNCGLSVKVIHLVRNPLKTWMSEIKANNWEIEGMKQHRRFRILRIIPGWFIANIYAAMCKIHLGKDNYMKIRYEDMVSRPNIVLERIGNYIGVNLSTQISMIDGGLPFEVGHNVGGNRVRLKKKIVIKKDS